MPVDHSRRLVFVHIPKTGGTTILSLLGLWRKHRTPDFQVLFGDFGAVDLQHLTLSQLQQFLTPHEWASYFKFAFVRNPWDRAVSAALWQTRFQEQGVRDLRDYVDWAERVKRLGPQRGSDVHVLPQSAFLPPPNDPQVVSIGRFENFARDINDILGKLEKLPVILPHKLKTAGRLHYRDYYGGGLAERVARVYAEDVARFAYTF